MLVFVLTRVLPSFVSLNEADDEKDQDEQSNGTHEAYEPSLSGDVHLSAHHRCPKKGKSQIISNPAHITCPSPDKGSSIYNHVLIGLHDFLIFNN